MIQFKENTAVQNGVKWVSVKAGEKEKPKAKESKTPHGKMSTSQ